MERIKKTLWPRSYMEVSPEHVLRWGFGFPTHLIKSLFPLLGKDKVLELVKTAAAKNMRSWSESPYYDGFRCESFNDFLQKSQGIMSTLLWERVPWRTELVQKTTVMEQESLDIGENRVKFKTIKCLWADIFKEMDAADIGRVWVCEGDYEMAKAWNPNIVLERTQTIMEGASHCDFCFHWVSPK